MKPALIYSCADVLSALEVNSVNSLNSSTAVLAANATANATAVPFGDSLTHAVLAAVPFGGETNRAGDSLTGGPRIAGPACARVGAPP